MDPFWIKFGYIYYTYVQDASYYADGYLYMSDTLKINENTYYDVFVNRNARGDTLFYNHIHGVVGFRYEGKKYSLKLD